MNGPDYKQAHWGVLAIDAETGKTVYERNPDRLFTPASTTKLYTCATALATFGPDYRFLTPVYRRGEASGNRLLGDLILVASGDLMFGGRTNSDGKAAFVDNDHIYADFNSTKTQVTDTDPLGALHDLARQVRQAGFKQIGGEILIDDRLFPKAEGSGSGPSILSPIIVNDNVVDLIVTPASESGKPAMVKMRPECTLVQMDAQVQTVEKGRSPFVEVRSTGPQRFTVRGHIAADARPAVRIWPVDDPALFARALFIECLRKEGIAVAASPLRKPTAELPPRNGYEQFARVALHESLPLSETIKVTLKVSHNLYASTLPLLVAAKHDQSSIADGLRWQRRFLQDLEVPVGTISFGGGAGGSNADCVTPRATVKLLQAMRQRKEYDAWHAGFPILGIDGTLAESVDPKSPARGKAQAKTGTISWYDSMNGRTLLRSKALAGTLTTANDHELYFAMFVNDVPLPPGMTPTREGRTLGKLCEILYEQGP
jgi:D-alanyl-D-alanine carboxypeptidase/D-alanyl-D-alanine-endopeptidase (penicillin-binding protein 4)